MDVKLSTPPAALGNIGAGVGIDPYTWTTTGALVAANRLDVFEVPRPLKAYTLTTAWYLVSSHTGTPNLCIALYDVATQTRIGTTGSFAYGGTNALLSQALLASCSVYAGQRLAATIIGDNTGVTFTSPSGNAGTLMKQTGIPLFGGFSVANNFPAPLTLPVLGDTSGRCYGVYFT